MRLHSLSVFGKLPVFLLIQGIAIMASAQVYNSSISAAAGGTGRGAVEASDAVYLNSAALVHLKGHNITSSFAENQFAISISDNSEESSLPASFAYVQKDVDFPTSRYTEHNFMLALAEFAFAWHVRHIDFVPYGIDGAPPSPPLLKSLFVPFVPVLMNGLLLIAHRRAGRNPLP